MSSTPTKRPPRLTSVHQRQASLGATFVQDDYGWLRAQKFTNADDEVRRVREGAGIADIGHLAKFSLQGQRVIDAASSTLLEETKRTDRGTAFWIANAAFKETLCALAARDEAIFLTNPSSANGLSQQLASSFQSGFHSIDMTSVLTGLCILGSKSREVMAKLTELDLDPGVFPNLAVARAGIHHVQCTLLRMDLGGMAAYQLYFERAYGEYMWDVVSHAGSEFKITPVGVEALKILGWRWG